jgi:hypothetical protein
LRIDFDGIVVVLFYLYCLSLYVLDHIEIVDWFAGRFKESPPLGTPPCVPCGVALLVVGFAVKLVQQEFSWWRVFVFSTSQGILLRNRDAFLFLIRYASN